MTFAKTIASLGVLGLMAAPLAAQSGKLDIARLAAPVADAENLAGDTGLLALVGVVAALGAFIVILSDDDDEPASP